MIFLKLQSCVVGHCRLVIHAMSANKQANEKLGRVNPETAMTMRNDEGMSYLHFQWIFLMTNFLGERDLLLTLQRIRNVQNHVGVAQQTHMKKKKKKKKHSCAYMQPTQWRWHHCRTSKIHMLIVDSTGKSQNTQHTYTSYTSDSVLSLLHTQI